MNTQNKIQCALLTGIMVASFAAPAMADLASMQPVQEGNIAYITGGIGDEELQALKDSSKNYDLKITNSDQTGHYKADTNVQISSKDGLELLHVDGTGPLFYVNLPAGEYTVRAANGDQHEVRKVKVSASKSSDLHFVWQGD